MWLEGQDTEIMKSKSPYNLQVVHLRTKKIYEDGKLVSDFLKDFLEGNYLYVLDLNQTLHVYPTELATRKTTQEHQAARIIQKSWKQFKEK